MQALILLLGQFAGLYALVLLVYWPLLLLCGARGPEVVGLPLTPLCAGAASYVLLRRAWPGRQPRSEDTAKDAERH